ncbi:MAG: hypothetical protein KDD92_10785 [Caldilineaceae bacterium]|nr:hypothetical protein [Caldilineaceae bacterium]
MPRKNATTARMATGLAAALLLMALTAACAPLAIPDTPPPTETAESRNASAPATTRADGPAALLRYIPDTSNYRSFTTYGDYAAWLKAWEIDPPADIDAVKSLPETERERWLFTMPSQTTPPQALGIDNLTEPVAEHYGFSFFDRSRYLEAGNPPETLTVTASGDGDGAIASALLATGYASAPAAPPFTLYSIRDDYAIDINSPLRIGRLGELNRIAVSEEMVLIGRATEVVENGLEAADAGTSLADAPDMQALLRSLDAPELTSAGTLVGLILTNESFTPDIAGLLLGNDPVEEIEAQWDALFNQEPRLPIYLLTGFATYRAPDATYLALHVVFPIAEDATDGAEILAERMANYISFVTEAPLPWTLESAFIDEATTVIVMRLDESAVLSWIDLFARRDTVFLVN